MYNIKDLVANNNKVKLIHARDKQLWYQVVGTEFTFPVPMEDTVGGTFLVEDRAFVFMRWIRKEISSQ